MGFWHALIGVGEGLITAGLVSYLLGVRPDLLAGERQREAAGTRGVAIVLGVVALAAAGLSFIASARPDGLEFVYFEKGLGAASSEPALVQSPMPDYALPGIANETLAGVLAGVVGLVLTGVLLYVGVKAIRARPGAGTGRRG
jgi:cobalt/nickel transport system permease protein